ncbi:MAG: hypothetical protein C5B52_13925 [Bacteroidetes bacterium]|nr:MAG: hypothetical protein C5B52_13925 [Bacteroidota bacterium]
MKSKETQGRLWGRAPQDWTKLIEPAFIPLYRAALQKLNINSNTVLLDAGCGSGLFLSMTPLDKTNVYGIDATPELMQLAKKRNPEGTFLIEDLEDIPYGDEYFDIVTGFNSFQFTGNRLSALNQAKRVTKKGGYIAIAIWDEPRFSDASTVFASLASLLPAPAAGAPGPYALSADGALENMASQAGLYLHHKEKINCPFLFTSKDELYRAFLCTGPAVKTIESIGEEKTRQVILRNSEPYRIADEIYFMNNQFKFFLFQK